MKRIGLIGMVVAAMAAGLATMAADPAYCVWCPTYKCFGPCGIDGCVCISAPGEAGGQCYGMNLEIPEGWEILE